jgi:hypothetical protein
MKRTAVNAPETRRPESLDSTLIAPCGMNCGICSGHLREKKRCPGCNGDDAGKPNYCVVCRIKYCGEAGSRARKFCFECAQFPCARLRRLDKRYRTNYGMSMIENLENIRKLGLNEFVAREKSRWKCSECGGVICVHKKNCVYCGRARS